METWFVVAGVLVIIGGCIAYAIIAILYPEWVGISGKVAKDVQESHQEDTPGNGKKSPSES